MWHAQVQRMHDKIISALDVQAAEPPCAYLSEKPLCMVAECCCEPRALSAVQQYVFCVPRSPQTHINTAFSKFPQGAIHKDVPVLDSKHEISKWRDFIVRCSFPMHLFFDLMFSKPFHFYGATWVRYLGKMCSGKSGCFWSKFTAKISKLMGALFCNCISTSNMA